MAHVRWTDLLDLELNREPTREDCLYLIGLVRELQVELSRYERGSDDYFLDEESFRDGYRDGYSDGYHDGENGNHYDDRY